MRHLAILLLFVGFGAQAAKVKVTSFYRVGDKDSKISELCGKIEDMTEEYMIVKVISDPRSKQPGIYNVWVGPEAKFCTTLISTWGEADAVIREKSN